MLFFLAGSSNAFVAMPTRQQSTSKTVSLQAIDSRRSFLTTAVTTTATVLSAACILPGQAANAAGLALVTVDEFEKILRDSARSVQLVEFSGAKSESITITLVDGTSFGLSDIVESSTDPRSPLKVAAICRSYKVPTKFSMLETALMSSPKKTKVYMNSRVQEAAQKEKAKKERMAQDEAERLAELSRLEE